ncbi:CinA family nicotinamide mononucleotide deamidase-related protein [bacterium]|jgi:nicotinamide-nucleotide amidase|nr:CinA family nicotinamide mononucleotide deamidase-related protein [bacterium]
MKNNLKIQLICTGNELLDGRVTNTNLPDIASHLSSIGLHLSNCHIVSDVFQDLVSSIKTASNIYDIIILTGGLGPTDDDRTTEAVCTALNISNLKNKAANNHLIKFFSERNKQMTASNLKQAFLPETSEIIHNPIGTAPGYILNVHSSKNNKIEKDTSLISLPGVPIEMNMMMKETVLDFLKNSFKTRLTIPTKKTFSCYGIGESVIADELEEIYPLPDDIDILYRATHPNVHVSITSKKDTSNFQSISSHVNEKLKNYIYSENGKSLEETVVTKFINDKITLSIAESCTGGLLSSSITSIPGSSSVLMQSIVCYSNMSKVKTLNVYKSDIDIHGAVSEAVAIQLANNVKALSKTNIGVGITGISGPSGGSKDKPVGTVFIAISNKEKTSIKRVLFHGSRNIIQKKVVAETLFLLLKQTVNG